MGVCVEEWLGDDEGSVIDAGAWLGEPPMLSFLALSLSLSLSLSSSLSWNSFEGKIETEIHFRLIRAILQSTQLISV